MIESSEVAVVLLAAGQSRRFGAGDKLAHDYQGRPLVTHAAEMLGAVPFGRHIAVVNHQRRDDLPAWLEQVINEQPERGLGSSLALGVTRAIDSCAVEIRACLVMLGDMPLVPRAHIDALLAAFDRNDPKARLGTRLDNKVVVPAIFGEDYFPALKALDGDVGARELLQGAHGLSCDPAYLRDFDYPQDFAQGD